ncbi:hypothetical protein [Caryophanon tenue]|uniref:Uncharacterized protein n=1 Tax=Caryophanon tenue TaxID=33978 RepID=A0A1C0Y520_9BACL|nr:hypothetical protein [Caryophanon tenue]OCS82260.1 hypothetical protein A6M13_07440 [Caryophanon tenue]
MAKQVKNNGVYIRTIEAAVIWEVNNRGNKAQDNYTGYIPHSLELMKLSKVGIDKFIKRLKPKLDADGNEMKNDKGKVIRAPQPESVKNLDKRTLQNISRFYTDDVINVKFKSKVHDLKGVIANTNKRYDNKIEAAKSEEEVNALNKERDERIKEITARADGGWSEIINTDELRDSMYKDGFTFKNYKGEMITYRPYKRSSAKARTGEILFIREELLDEMTKWSRMSLELSEDVEIDLAAWSAYEALVASAIEGTIEINPKNILLISDVESVFTQEAITINTVKDENGKSILQSKTDANAEIKNSLFDGQGLLDSSYFTGKYEGKGMMLTRQHFWKSALFNTNIEQFMRDEFGDAAYETDTIKDMLGNKIKIKDVKCIVTPSSLKIFKFSFIKGSDKEMYKHWKSIVKGEKNVFGVCKSEYASKRGSIEGKPLNQMSYQMLNSLPITKDKTTKLCQFEIDYINDMKESDDKFIEYLVDTATMMNSNDMIVDLYNRNCKFAKTDLFITFKKNAMSEYAKRMRKGKLRIVGDYCVLVGNPYEMLLHSINKLNLHNLKSHTLEKNQVHTKLFDDGEELAGFRNPHTSANNILHAQNVHNKKIDTYFNFTNNIVAVNAIEFALQDLLSGCDYDSDTALLTNNDIIVDVAKKNTSQVCLNKVSATSNTYKLTALNRSEVDKAIASDVIGSIVNVGQAAQSVMYDAIYNYDKDTAKIMKEVIEIVSVASTIAIDGAKKSYDIEIDKELKRLDKLVRTKLRNSKFPLFMERKSNSTQYDTTMDYVYKKFKVEKENEDGVQRAKVIKAADRIDMMTLVNKAGIDGKAFKIAQADDKQEKEVLEIVNEYINNTNQLQSIVDNQNSKEELKKTIKRELRVEAEEMQKRLTKRTIKPVTLYAILYHLFEVESTEESVLKVMNVIYKTHKKQFVNAFLGENEQEK